MATSLSDVDIQGQVHDRTTVEQKVIISVNDWLGCYERILDEFSRKGRVPPSFTKDQKCIAHCIGPILCCPCIAWSTFFRVLLSPFMCLLTRTQGMCGGNVCTRAPDVFVREYYHLLGAYIKVPCVTPPRDLNLFTDEDLDRYIRILRRSLAIITLDGFNAKEKKKLNYKVIYDVSDACFHCLPANAPQIISNLLIEAMRTRDTRKHTRKPGRLHT